MSHFASGLRPTNFILHSATEVSVTSSENDAETHPTYGLAYFVLQSCATRRYHHQKAYPSCPTSDLVASPNVL